MMTVTFSGNAAEVSQDMLQFINGLQYQNKEAGKPQTAPKEKAKKETPSTPETVTPETLADQTSETVLPDTTLTVEAVRALANAKKDQFGQPAVKDIITKLGFKKLPEITPDKFQEFVDLLNAMA